MGSSTSSLGIPKTNWGHKEPSQWCALFSDTPTVTKCLSQANSLHNKGAFQHLSLKSIQCMSSPQRHPCVCSHLLHACLAVSLPGCQPS